MIIKHFNTILELITEFPNEQSCIDYLTTERWDGEIISPFDNESKIYLCKHNKFKCKSSGKYFTVRTNTLFSWSKLPLQKWFIAIWLITSHKKGISSVQLSKDIGVTQKTSWNLLQKIRKCFYMDVGVLDGDVEVDETFVGGKNKNRHKDKKVANTQGRSFKDKTPVIGAIQRGGLLTCEVIATTSKKDIHPYLKKTVKKGCNLHTDEWRGYMNLEHLYNHTIVNHAAKQYADGHHHSNTIEGAWSHLKRMIIGIYHWVSKKHLQKYVDEFVFRYNTRHMTGQDRFEYFLSLAL